MPTKTSPAAAPESRNSQADRPDRSWRANPGKVLRFAAQRASEKNLTQVASSLTFTTVLAIVPLLAVVLALFTAFPLFDDFRIALENFLTENLMPAAVSENVMGYLNQFASQASRLTAIGTLFLIVTSIMLMMTIDTAFNDIWQVRRQRPIRQRMLVYWAILSLGPILAGGSLWATTVLARESLDQAAQVSAILSFALSFIPIVVTGLGFTLLFVTVPNRKVFWKDAIAGGFCSAIVLGIMKTGFAYYLVHFPSYTAIYGAFATVPIFLLWIYMSWLAILFGATIAATLPLLRLRLWAKTRQAGTTFVDAIQVLRLLRKQQQKPQPGCTSHFLSTHMKLQQDDLILALQALEELGYIVSTEDADADRWVLACDPQEAQLGPLIDALLINRHQPGFAQDRLLVDAVSAALTQSNTVKLQDILENPGSQPETGVIVQNTLAGSLEPIQENNNAESQ